jgi:hypothetical protein
MPFSGAWERFFLFESHKLARRCRKADNPPERLSAERHLPVAQTAGLSGASRKLVSGAGVDFACFLSVNQHEAHRFDIAREQHWYE